MPLDVSADPWGAAMLGAAAVAALGLLVVLFALVRRSSRRAGGWIMSIGLVGFLGSAVAGTFVRVRAADAAARAEPIATDDTAAKDLADTASADERAPDDAPEPIAAAEAGEPDADTAADDGDAPSEPPAQDTPPKTLDKPDEPDPAPADEGTPASDEAPKVTRPEVEALPEDPEEKKRAANERIKDAKALTLDETRCKDPQALAIAWAQIDAIPKDMMKDKIDALVERLEKCRRRVVAARAWVLKRDRMNDRKAFVDTLQKRLVAEGISNAWVGTTGKEHDTLRAAGKGLDNAKADALLDAGLRDELVGMGYTLAVFSDGRSGRRVELEPPSVSDVIRDELAPLGLDKILKR